MHEQSPVVCAQKFRFLSIPQDTIPPTGPVSSPVPDLLDSVDDFRLVGDELDSLLDCVPTVEESAEVKSPLFALAYQYPAALYTDNGIKASLVVVDTHEVES